MRLLKLLAAAGAAATALASKVDIKDSDILHQVCEGMYGGKDAYIEVSFGPESSGEVAFIIFEWKDIDFIGAAKAQPEDDMGYLPEKKYICTSPVVAEGLCTADKLGAFITVVPEGHNTSIYTTPLRFNPKSSGEASDNKPAEESPVAGGDGPSRRAPQGTDTPPTTTTPVTQNPNNVKEYTEPIKYDVPKTGYYCVGVVPLTLPQRRDAGPVERAPAEHATFTGTITFRNQFKGELAAADFPKVGLYGVLSIVYCLLAAGWAFLCVRHYQELLPMQYYISGTIVFLIVEMLALFAYYRYVNKHGAGAGSTAFLVVISILNAARTALSLFLLLIVSMGLSVVTPSLGSIMTRVRILTAFHFIFGVAYAVGNVKVDIDSASLLIVLGLVIPLAVTLTTFLMWIIISLNGTILHLQERKQTFKLKMFQRLWRILIIAVIAVGAFFILSSISLSNRLDDDYEPSNWRWRWLLLDASLALIYLATFSAVSWLWRPTDNNVRFSMSTELAQDEADAEDYEIDSLQPSNAHLQADPLGLEPDEGRIRIHGDDDDGDYDERQRMTRDSLDDEDERKGFIAQSKVKSSGGTDGTSHQPIRAASGPGEVNDDNVVFTMGDDSDDEQGSPSRLLSPAGDSRRSSGSKSKSD